MNGLDLQGEWIWCRGEERPRNFTVCFRKSFFLAGPVRDGSIRVTADSRYRLSVNGIWVARGPARCDPRWQCLDEWDISRELRPGENVIAAIVHHYGDWTFSYILGRAGFLADIRIRLTEGESVQIGTDALWRVQPAQAWGNALPRMNLQLGYPEVYDARREAKGWETPGFDDAEWDSAVPLGRAGMDPWPHFRAREIPAMRETLLLPERVMETGEVGIAATGFYVDLLQRIWNPSNAVAYLATSVRTPRDVDVQILAGSQDAIKLWVNGRLVISNCVTRDPAPDQETARVTLRCGWNTILAKIVQGEGQWHFYFRIAGEGSGELVYAQSAEGDGSGADPLRPWMIIGPFDSTSVQNGFDTAYPPELKLDFATTYQGKEGKEIRWASAGATRESMFPSVIMSREERFPGRGEAIDSPDGLIGRGPPAVVPAGALHGRYAVIDFGKEVSGHPVIEIDGAEGGEILDCGYAEVLQSPEGRIILPLPPERGIVNPDRSGVHYADRYICRPGKQRFQTFEKRAFRYMQIDLRSLRRPLTVGPVSLMLSTYPVEYAGEFECADPLLNRIWDVGRWTVQLTMEDAYTDCPWRERAQWWGDARVQALVNYYAFGDHALMRQGLRHIAQSQTDDGLTSGVYPAGWPGGVLPTFTLLWVVSLAEFYRFTGDRALVADLFPCVRRALEYFERFRAENDLLNDLPGWLFIDWAEVETGGASTAINALHHGALSAAAELAEAIGETSAAVRYASLAKRTKSGMRQVLWDNSRNCFRDALLNGTLSRKISEQANAWAVEFGAVPDGSARSILDALIERHEANVTTATPYAGFSMLNALARSGLHGAALNYIRTHWGRMLDAGATTFWEHWEPRGSFCHGWSAGPTHFLPAEILGVKPEGPGWDRILIEPHPGGLGWARGKVPTPHGPIAVEWRMEKKFSLLCSVPAPARVIVPRMKKGTVSATEVHSNAEPEPATPANREAGITVLLNKAGEYRISSR